jgi:DnaJ-class molecular chaperone
VTRLNEKDYYTILGVSRTASLEEIKKAHKRLARKYHPDLNPGDKKAEEQFKTIQAAYDVLSDADKRKKYDQFGPMWEQMSAAGAGPYGGARPGGQQPPVDFGGFGGADIHDFFENIFGGVAGRGGRTPGFGGGRTPDDIVFTTNISLEEAYKGASKSLNVTVDDVCPECEGIGQKKNAKGQFDLNNALACSRCRGSGRVASQRTVPLNIPPGVTDGYQARIAGQGAADVRGRRNDLLIQINITKHPRFERDGQNLTFDAPVPYTVAALGGKIFVEMPGGQKREVNVPAGIQSGQRMRLTGQGMPAFGGKPGGDAYARVKITVPKDLSDREIALLEQLAEMRNEHVKK